LKEHNSGTCPALHLRYRAKVFAFMTMATHQESIEGHRKWREVGRPIWVSSEKRANREAALIASGVRKTAVKAGNTMAFCWLLSHCQTFGRLDNRRSDLRLESGLNVYDG
jgi:hypothetical protein